MIHMFSADSFSARVEPGDGREVENGQMRGSDKKNKDETASSHNSDSYADIYRQEDSAGI